MLQFKSVKASDAYINAVIVIHNVRYRLLTANPGNVFVLHTYNAAYQAGKRKRPNSPVSCVDILSNLFWSVVFGLGIFPGLCFNFLVPYLMALTGTLMDGRLIRYDVLVGRKSDVSYSAQFSYSISGHINSTDEPIDDILFREALSQRNRA